MAGPLDHSAIAFKPACAPQPKQAPATNHSGTHQDSTAARGPNQTGATLTTVMVAALQLMADYLVDPDVRTIKSVQFTLRHLLSSERGREALSQLDAVTQSYLQVRHLTLFGQSILSADGQFKSWFRAPDHQLAPKSAFYGA